MRDRVVAVDGDRNARIRLDAAPWGPGKIARRGFKWAIYLTISFWTGGAWIMYFADAPTLTRLLAQRLEISAALREGNLVALDARDEDINQLSMLLPWSPWLFHMVEFI